MACFGEVASFLFVVTLLDILVMILYMEIISPHRSKIGEGEFVIGLYIP